MPALARQAHRAFASRLARLLAAEGESQTSFAKLFGFKSTNVGKYLRAEGQPGFDTVQRIAERFRVSIDWLLYGEGGEGPIYRGETRTKAELEADVAKRLARAADDAAAREPFRAGPNGPRMGSGWGWRVDAAAFLGEAIKCEIDALRRWCEWEGGAGAVEDIVSQTKSALEELEATPPADHPGAAASMRDSVTLLRNCVSVLADTARSAGAPRRPHIVPASWPAGALAHFHRTRESPSDSRIEYDVEVAINGGEWAPLASTLRPEGMYNPEGLPPGTRVDLRVRARDTSDGKVSPDWGSTWFIIGPAAAEPAPPVTPTGGGTGERHREPPDTSSPVTTPSAAGDP